MSIQSFGDKATQIFFINQKIQGNPEWRNIEKIALRKLDMLNYAKELNDLRSPTR